MNIRMARRCLNGGCQEAIQCPEGRCALHAAMSAPVPRNEGTPALAAPEAAEPAAPVAEIVMKGGEIVKAATYMPGLPDGEHELYAAAPATAWGPLTEGERAQAVSEICEHGTGFVAPLFAIIEGIERKLMERNAAPTDSQAGRDAVEAAIDAFEMKERGLPQAHIAARLVAELRAALSTTTGRAAE